MRSNHAPARTRRLLLVTTLAVVATTLTAGCGKSDGQAPTDGATPKVIRVTGIPDENPTELQRRNAPLVAHLKAALGTDVTYVPVTDYGAAVQALAAGKVDFAWLGGFTHVQSRHLAKVEPLVMRAIDRQFKSVFIANVASGITKMADFKGKTFAFGSKSSTSGHLMPRHFLATQYSIDAAKDFAGTPVFSGAHDATVKLVESGKVAGGAVNAQVWERMLKAKSVDPAKVALIWTTPGYVDYVWTARTDLPEALRKKFAAAFLTLDASKPEHAAVLKLQGAASYVQASPSDFDAIEKVARSTGLLTGSGKK